MLACYAAHTRADKIIPTHYPPPNSQNTFSQKSPTLQTICCPSHIALSCLAWFGLHAVLQNRQNTAYVEVSIHCLLFASADIPVSTICFFKLSDGQVL